MFSPLSKQAHRPLDTHLTGAWVVGREAARRLSAAQQAGSIIYRVDAQGLTAVLDSEFAGWGDRLEDIGWFCARCWRTRRAAIGSREALYRGYERVYGRPLERAQVVYGEAFAHRRWAVIALQQGERHVAGREPSLEPALTAHIVPELELQILRMTGIAPGEVSDA